MRGLLHTLRHHSQQWHGDHFPRQATPGQGKRELSVHEREREAGRHFEVEGARNLAAFNAEADKLTIHFPVMK
jgi:hypothetical protein